MNAAGQTMPSFAFLEKTVDETVLEGRYKSALLAWKQAMKSADPSDARGRQRLELLQRAYLESLSALEEARAASAQTSLLDDVRLDDVRLDDVTDERFTALRNAEMVLRQHDARESASQEAWRRGGLLARIFGRG
jgi:hypothetical protein